MLIYQCSGCSMIITVSKPLTSPRCGKCNGWLARICQTPNAVSYLEGLGGRQKLRQMDTVGSALPSRQVYQKPSVTADPSGKKNINGEGPLNSGRIQSASIPSSLPVNSPPQILKETMQNTSQRQEETTPKTGSPTLQDLPGIMTYLELSLAEIKRNILNLRDGKSFQGMPGPQDPWAAKWRGILSRYPRILIIGAQGTGKSCLAYYLTEILHSRSRCYVYRLPEEGISLIPSWLGVIQNLEEVPPGSIVLIDESYLTLFSRESSSRQNKNIVKIINLARQKKLGFIFVAHEARHIDKNLLSCIDTLVIKKPGPLQVGLDRSLLKPFLLKAQNAFQDKNEAISWKTSYVGFASSGFEGMLENLKASFWSEKLSHIFASGKMGGEARPAQELSRKEKKKRAKTLHDEYGYSYADIGLELGVGKTTAYRWVNEKPQSGTRER